jgi:hypothetical protein
VFVACDKSELMGLFSLLLLIRRVVMTEMGRCLDIARSIEGREKSEISTGHNDESR